MGKTAIVTTCVGFFFYLTPVDKQNLKGSEIYIKKNKLLVYKHLSDITSASFIRVI